MSGTTLAVRAVDAPVVFTAEQRQMIRDAFANGAGDEEFAVLMEIAKARRLNPLLRQVFFVKRWDSQKRREVWSTQVSIDGLRAIAERTGKYDGQDEPEYIYGDGGALACAKVRVYRKDWSRPAVGVAYFGEYAQKTKEGGLTQFWREKPHVMLAKCAEALAHRKAFPEDTAGLYVPEEMGSAVDTTGEPVIYDRQTGEVADAEVARPMKAASAPSHNGDAAMLAKAAEFEDRLLRCGSPAEADALAAEYPRGTFVGETRARVIVKMRARKEALIAEAASAVAEPEPPAAE